VSSSAIPLKTDLAIFDRLDGLPTIPIAAQRTADLVNDPRATAEMVAQALSADQSLTAKVLKLANSAYYGIPGGVSDVRHAISFLGFNTISQLVLTVSVISSLTTKGSDALSLRALWLHSLGCATLAEILARRLHLPDPPVIFTGGLLHDIGKVALMQVAPQQFNEAVAVAHAKGIKVQAAEALVGLPQDEVVGKRLAERWRFPMPLRMAIGHHEFLGVDARRSVPRSLGPVVDVTAMANQLVRRMGVGDPGDKLVPDLDPDLLKRLNLSTMAVDTLRGDLMRAIEHSRTLLDLIG